MSVGFTVGTEFEDRLFSQSKARFSRSVETSMDWTAKSTREIQKAFYYNGSRETDKVVFTTIPFDVYYYRILASPNPEEVDSTMIISLPRDPQILFVDVDFFNENNGQFSDLDERVLGHKIGDPATYPAFDSIDTEDLVANGGAYSDVRTVGQGVGSQTAEIIISEGTGYGTSFDLSVTSEAEVGSGGFFVGVSFGYHYGFSYNVTSTNSTIYRGTVGNIIDADDWTENRFDFGLYVRPRNVLGQRFPVVGYWVD